MIPEIHTSVGLNQINPSVGNLPNLGAVEGVAGPLGSRNDKGTVHNVAVPSCPVEPSDIAGLDGAGSISEKELDRNDDLGMLFARGFGASMPAMPKFPDP